MTILDFQGPQGAHQELFAGEGSQGGGLLGRGLGAEALCTLGPQEGTSPPGRGSQHGDSVERGSRSERPGQPGVPGRALWEKEGQVVNSAEGVPAKRLCTEGGAHTPARAAWLGRQAGPGGPAGGARLGCREAGGGRRELEVRLPPAAGSRQQGELGT